MFRPHVRIVDGVVEAFDEPENMFQLSRDRQFLLFNGKEPNMDWAGFAECIFAMADRYGVRRMFFVGSVSGLVPHTRDPRLFSSISHPELKDEVARFGLQLTNYEGPGSFITQLMVECRRRELPLITVVAEVPAYVAGNNIRCIESVVRTLSAVTSSPIDFDDLRVASDELEKRISDAVAEKPELAGHIRKLEEQYDNEVFDTQMGDLKDWLEDQGIVLD